MHTKACRSCGLELPVDRFGKCKTGKGGLRARCKACISKASSRYYRANKPRIDATNARNRFKGYGLPIKMYEDIFRSQGGVCAICGAPPTRRVRLAVDHRHVDGYDLLGFDEKRAYVRGLLCRPCNTAIEFFNESPPLLEEAARYLERFAAKKAS